MPQSIVTVNEMMVAMYAINTKNRKTINWKHKNKITYNVFKNRLSIIGVIPVVYWNDNQAGKQFDIA